MAKIEVVQNHALPLPEARTRMEKVQAELTAKYGLSFQWEGEQQLKVSGKGVKGTIQLGATQVSVLLDLSLLLSPLKGKIESRLREQLTEQLK
ncbi:MAG: polyhydroxyalkanoic acid system family protein [Polyangia bacterium]|jgi:putative polyhydroxyalkanoate system protein|nr:polyhydroxyalkanoic acid system family protein [Polyangia bacterium]